MCVIIDMTYDTTKIQTLKEISSSIFERLQKKEDIDNLEKNTNSYVGNLKEDLYKELSKMINGLKKDFYVNTDKISRSDKHPKNKKTYAFIDSEDEILTMYELYNKPIIKKLRKDKKIKLEDLLSESDGMKNVDILSEFFSALKSFQRKNIQQTSEYRLNNADPNALSKMDLEEIVEKYSEDVEIEKSIRWTDGFFIKYLNDEYFEIIELLRKIFLYADTVLSNDFISQMPSETLPEDIISDIRKKLDDTCKKIPEIVDKRASFYLPCSININHFM